MKCCINCFRDAHLQETIKKLGYPGDCDFCDSKGIATCDISNSSNPISEKIIELVQIYSVSNDRKAKPLKIALRDDWDIFKSGAETILALTKKLCAGAYTDDADVFLGDVIIEQLTENDSVVCGDSWYNFSESIKYDNRFHQNKFNADAFKDFLSIIGKIHPADKYMYRARISTKNKGFTVAEMGAPPKNKRTEGRINPAGIGILYLSSDKKTVIHEVRASAFDYVTIGTFKAKRNNIKLVDLSGLGQISPFLYGGLEKFAANRKIFQEIAAEIAKPLRRSDSPLEYLPTQYIAEFIKSLRTYDGVEYASTLYQGGSNLAVFDEGLFECIDVETVEVSEIAYSTKPGLSV